MPNTLLLPEKFATYDFVSLAKKEPHPKNRLRLIAMGHIQDGKTLKVVASYIKVHWKSVQRWLTNFRMGGIDALYVKTTKHKPQKLNEEIQNRIKHFLEALNANDTGGYVTGKQLHDLIEKEFSVTCCLRTVYNTLHRLKFSWITARSKHPKSDEEIQALYKKLSRLPQKYFTKES